MAVKLTISYETLVDLVEQLSESEKQDLLRHLQQHRHQPSELTVEEKIKLLEAAQIHAPMAQEPSMRREDWYD